jgi:hypothetical protein
MCLLILPCFGCSEAQDINGDEEEAIPEIIAIEEEYITSPEEKVDTDIETSTEEQEENTEVPVVPATVTLYYIDHENGIIPITDLPIGARVVDPSRAWEHRLGFDYSDIGWEGAQTPPGEVKPITWIVVAKDHYDINESHVTLLSEELIGRHTFDNHWGESGADNATRGLRPWLNSTGIHAGKGFFYQAFSVKFMTAVLTTPVPNREWKEGKTYITNDNIFIPSTTELGDTAHSKTYQIGATYPYFQNAVAAERVARIGGETEVYWTRSPDSGNGSYDCLVNKSGEFDIHYFTHYEYYGLFYGVRPALNLKADTLVTENRD